MSDCSSESSEENKFTPEKIAEKKTRPYLLVELFDKNINNIKGHALYEIGDNEDDVKCFTQKDLFGTADLMVKGYVARQFRDCINKVDDIKTVQICINNKRLAFYDYSIPTLFDLVDKTVKPEATPKPKRKYTRKIKPEKNSLEI
jgi:hypothetical protein